ncbi:Excinuclease ABC subunit C [Sedimentisphaera cyanobacteriorum]|uniref:Excinuclease ABC subunit C n=1 Tax=Sedimentisphaera cyanobacteriorum TaxID=1940790 RepID=A0A1Q2HRQ3_9BACT|nr:excinuclease ABC subunit UvrC [Sedimentisphaera cyanobacteriorum]AQQ10139.1 Excinuclease ABC subunit C [Sedimentisphaera cyanobacteriorum]
MAEDKGKIEKIREKIRQFPASPGLYFMKDSKDAVLYIGKAKNLRSRVSSYFLPSSDIYSSRGPKIAEMLEQVCSVSCLETESEVDAILQEARLIKDIRPPYNTNLLDDKTFPYLQITTYEDFPGVYITRNPGEKRCRLFGPFTAIRELRGVLVLLQKIFKFRTCKLEISADDEKRRFFRPCLLHSINQCTAPCAAKINKEEYSEIIEELTKFLRSKRSVVLRDLKDKMQKASSRLRFEEAAEYRDKINLISKLESRGTVSENVQPELFVHNLSAANQKLAEMLGSADPIRTIEGFDIAHLGGSETVGSLVKFIDGSPFKHGYRRFKIKTVEGIDDYASMQEVIRRRYKRAMDGRELLPDMLLIDGGLGQLHAVENVLDEFEGQKPYLASLAKKEELIYISGKDRPLRLPANSPVRKLFQYIRDESHRFAQHYHHILRRKAFLEEAENKAKKPRTKRKKKSKNKPEE